MQALVRSELDKLVALQSGRYKKEVTAILDAYYSVVKEAILTGYKVDMPNIGYFTNTQVEAKPERVINSFVKGEQRIAPAHEAYNKPIFKFKNSLKKELKDETEGRVF